MYILNKPIYIFKSKIPIQDAKKESFSPTKTIEENYKQALYKVAQEIDKQVKRQTKGKDINVGKLIKLMKQLRNYSDDLNDWAKKKAFDLVYMLNTDNKQKWRRHSKKISKGLRKVLEEDEYIKNLMKQYMNQNAELITSLPITAAKKVQKLILETYVTGEKRSEYLIPEIMKLGDMTKNRAKLIARTETAKIRSGLTQARALSIGNIWYIWRTSEDARVRSSHDIMQDVLVRWIDPPSPEELDNQKTSYGHYHAGNIFNCRCYAEPVFEIDDIKFPAKVYMNGAIVNMTKKQFTNMYINDFREAA